MEDEQKLKIYFNPAEWISPVGDFKNKEEYKKACINLMIETCGNYHIIPYEQYLEYRRINQNDRRTKTRNIRA